MTIVTTVRYQGITDRYLQCKQGTVLNITGSYKHEQLIQQLMRSLEIRVKKHTNYKKKQKIVNTQTCKRRWLRLSYY